MWALWGPKDGVRVTADDGSGLGLDEWIFVDFVDVLEKIEALTWLFLP